MKSIVYIILLNFSYFITYVCLLLRIIFYYKCVQTNLFIVIHSRCYCRLLVTPAGDSDMSTSTHVLHDSSMCVQQQFWFSNVYSRVGLVMFKCSNNMLPNVISNLYIKNNEIHSHFTRNSNLLRIPKGTPNFTTISARVWNEIVTKILMDQHVSISKFKTMLKSYLLVSSFTLSYTK